MRGPGDVLYTAYERQLVKGLPPERLPRHVGLMLDGNRRWAKKRGANTAHGHKAGADNIEPLLTWCEELGIEVVTLWLLSTDNLKRSETELAPLLAIIEDVVDELSAAGNRRFNLVGALGLLPEATRTRLENAVSATQDGDGMVVNIAVGYGGRQEIVDAFRAILLDAAERGVLLDVAFVGLDVDLGRVGQFAQQLLVVGPQVHGDRLALQAFGAGDRVVALAGDDLCTVIDVGPGEGEARLALGGDGDLVGDRVDPPRIERPDQPREPHRHELVLLARAGADGVQHVHLEPLQLVVAGEGEGEILARHPHADRLGRGRASQQHQDRRGRFQGFDHAVVLCLARPAAQILALPVCYRKLPGSDSLSAPSAFERTG